METARILAIALESPVHWVRITCPGAPGDTEPPALPGRGAPLFLHYGRTRPAGGGWMMELVACPGPDLEPWFESSEWRPGAEITVERHAALVSLVGEEIISSGEALRRAESVLREAGIPLLAAWSSGLAISLLVPEERGEEASRALHASMIEA